MRKLKGRASTACLGIVASIDAACGVATVQWDSGRKEDLSLNQLDQLLLRRGGLVGHTIAPVRVASSRVLGSTVTWPH